VYCVMHTLVLALCVAVCLAQQSDNPGTFSAPLGNLAPRTDQPVQQENPKPTLPRGSSSGGRPVWLCDSTGERVAVAGTPVAEQLVAQGNTLRECPPAGRERGTTNLDYRGQLMCDSTGRRRGRSGSGYVRSLIRSGLQLQPCNENVQIGQETLQNNIRANFVFDREKLREQGIRQFREMEAQQRRLLEQQQMRRLGGQMMCDAQGNKLGSSNNGYVRALIDLGRHVTPCPVDPTARATDPSGAELQASRSSSSLYTPAWAGALIIVGCLVIVVIFAAIIRLAILIRRS